MGIILNDIYLTAQCEIKKRFHLSADAGIVNWNNHPNLLIE